MAKDFPPYLDYPKPRKPITNADRIRAMTDEELAHFLEMKAGRFVSFYPTPAKNWLDWLRQEVANDKLSKLRSAD